MKIIIRGKGALSLSKTDYVTEGGEGKIFSKGGMIYKIYTDPTKMVPEGKIQELHELASKSNIIIPLDIIMDEKGKDKLGFTMNEVINSVSLSQLFTTTFRVRNNIKSTSTVKLVEDLQNGIEFIHSKKCLIVDVNEFNFLVDDKSYVSTFFIDTNSYKTPSFPPTAIMPSIRDYLNPDFTTLSDWFSFSILAFQLFVGIHPYKGRHPKYSNKDLINRMKDNVSIFDKDVSVPQTVRDFSNIPSEYMKWFESLYSDGKRLPPPSVSGILNVIPVKTRVVTGTNSFEITLDREYSDEILSCNIVFGNKIVQTKDNKCHVGKTPYASEINSSIIITQKSGTFINVIGENDTVSAKRLFNGEDIYNVAPIRSKNLVNVENTIYTKNGSLLTEMVFDEINGRVLMSPKVVKNIMPLASSLFDGVLYENILGNAYFSILIPSRGVFEVHIPELDGHRIIEAKHERQVLMVISHKGNDYITSVICFDENFKERHYYSTMDSDQPNPLNFVVLDNGICVNIPEDGELQLFKNDYKSLSRQTTKDPVITSDMKLCKDGQRVMFFKGNRLYYLKMK